MTPPSHQGSRKGSAFVVGPLIFCAAGAYGAYKLVHWYCTGELWDDMRSRGEPSNWQLLTYEHQPVSFLFSFFLYGLYVIAGVTGAASLFRKYRSWVAERKRAH
jgi:hypothetical protein